MDSSTKSSRSGRFSMSWYSAEEKAASAESIYANERTPVRRFAPAVDLSGIRPEFSGPYPNDESGAARGAPA